MSRQPARLAATLLLLALAELGCSTESHGPAVNCGPGEYVEDPLGRFCVYVVIETGFTCPIELPMRIEFEGHMVCSDRMALPEDLPRSVCGRLPSSRCGGSTPRDAGVAPRDAGSDAAIADRLSELIRECYEYGDIVCAAMRACCMADELPMETEADCRMRYRVGCDVTHHGEAWDDGTITFDTTIFADWNEVLRARAATCDPDAGGDMPSARRGTLLLGADCTPVNRSFGVESDASRLWGCAPGLFCDITTDATGHHGACRMLGETGAACSNSTECISALTCEPSLPTAPEGFCGPGRADGAACDSWTDCAGGYCDHMICTSTPHARWCDY